MKRIHILTVIQARRGSTRLPDKILLPLAGKPLLIRMTERVLRSKNVNELVIATSTSPKDDLIENLCKEHRIDFFRGCEDDLLDRHFQAGLKYNADAVVKIPSDCPLIDPGVIDKGLSFFINNYPEYDYVSNLHPASYPDGNDVEVIKMSALKKAWENAQRKLEREHTTPYIWENPDMFNIGNFIWESGRDLSTDMRWTIDYEDDYRLIKKVYDELYTRKPDFTLDDILELLEGKPEISEINRKHIGEYWYKNHLNELNNIDHYKSKIKRSYE